MAWRTPKTDWAVHYDSDGNYTGDYFNASDYDRIKDNSLEILRLATELCGQPPTSLPTEIADKYAGDYIFADEINMICKIANEVANYTHVGSTVTAVYQYYYDNGPTPTAERLNELETHQRDIYERLTNMKSGLRNFEWNFGIKEIF